MVKPWRTTASEILVKDRWIHLRADTCESADGRVIAPYYVLEYPEFVNAIAITDQNEMVLIREYRHGGGVVGLGFPAGVMDREDADPLVTAKRELLEETGYTASEWVSLGALYVNWANQTNRIHYYLARGARLTGEQSLDENEEIEVVPTSVEHAIKPGTLVHSHNVAGLMLAYPYLK
jgi:8-oxo-dGTP pyrophosphatase MutT (NUDIX family)